jgi:hypothetical protein
MGTKKYSYECTQPVFNAHSIFLREWRYMKIKRYAKQTKAKAICLMLDHEKDYPSRRVLIQAVANLALQK